jgi:hypothetical protein
MLFFPRTKISVSLRWMLRHARINKSQAIFSPSRFHFALNTDGEAERWKVNLTSMFWVYWVLAMPKKVFTVGLQLFF